MQINYDSFRDAPYHIIFNKELATELFRDFGMPKDLIDRLIINIKRKGSRISYKVSAKKITLPTAWAWQKYQKNLKTARKIIQRKEEPNDQFRDLLYTRRLPKYLQTAPHKRGLEFATKLLFNAMQRKLNSEFLHEAKHALDDSEYNLHGRPLHEEALVFCLPLAAYVYGYHKILRFPLDDNQVYMYFAGLFGGMMLTYFLTNIVLNLLKVTLNPVERRAKKFQKQLKNHPKWRNIVEIIQNEYNKS